MPFCYHFLPHAASGESGQALLALVRPLPVGIIAVEGFCAVALIVVLVLVGHRLVRILSACGIEICLWQLCKAIFGPNALPSRIMTWVTAGVLIILTLTVVNNIKWRQYGEQRREVGSSNSNDGTTS